MDFICSKLYKTKNLKILDAVSRYINKKTSIDHIMKKLIEFDKTRFVLLNQHEINAMKLINVPSVSLICKNYMADRVQEFWGQYEFDDGLGKIEIEKLEEDFKKDNFTSVEKKILDLLERKTTITNTKNV